MKTKLELPDRRTITIEGADAQQVAEIVFNKLVRNGYVQNVPNAPAAQQPITSNEAPLELPALNFAKTAAQPAPDQLGEAALALPTTA